MYRENVELFWKHPGKFIFGLFLAVVALCTLLTFMPKWFNTMCGILMLVGLIKVFSKWEIKEEKKD